MVMRVMPPVREKIIGQNAPPELVASCMRTKYRPNPMPAIRGSFKSERCERISFTPPSPWEIIHTAKRAKPNLMIVRKSGSPCVNIPTTTGSVAASSAETGAAILITPVAMA